MTEEEIKALQDEKAELEKQLKEEKDARAKENEDHEKAIAEKDELIKQKNEDIVGTRRKYKKLADMTEEEREAMTEKEIELQQRQEELDARQAKSDEEVRARLQREVDARKKAAIARLAGEDEELAAKVEANYNRIADSGKAQTDEEVGGIVQEAFNMLGVPAPSNPVANAVGTGGFGASPDFKKEGDFSETPQGKDLAGALGLNQAKEEPKQ